MRLKATANQAPANQASVNQGRADQGRADQSATPSSAVDGADHNASVVAERSEGASPATIHPPTPATASEAAGGQPWASTFPHVEIDELLNRVSAAAKLTPSETTALLGAIVDEAKRLRATVVRLTAERVSAAEREAEEILSAARAEAAELRRSANDAMISRLDEAESASDAVLQAAHTDASRRSRQGQQLLAQTRTEVEDLRARVAAIFDSTNGILPLLGETASALGRMETEIAASTASDASVLAAMSDSAADSAADTAADSAADAADNDNQSDASEADAAPVHA